MGSTANVLADAKKTLAKANSFTNSVEGNPTSSFAPKKDTAPETASAPYHMAHTARKPSIKGLVDQAGAENTKPREDALKSLTGGTGSSAL
jgi:hypothetical protein